MASPFELAAHKGVQGVGSDLGAGGPGAEADHVGVVVLTAESCRADVVDDRRAHAGDLVGGDGDSDPGAAHADPEVAVPEDHLAAHCGAEVRIVDGVGRVGTEVDDRVAVGGEMLADQLLQSQTGMVATQLRRARWESNGRCPGPQSPAPGALARFCSLAHGPCRAVTGLHKEFGARRRSAGWTSRCSRGEVLALLGPNGAGKTTTVEILEGYQKATAGKVAVLGYDPRHDRRQMLERVGIVLQETAVEQFLTVARGAQAPGRLLPPSRVRPTPSSISSACVTRRGPGSGPCQAA